MRGAFEPVEQMAIDQWPPFTRSPSFEMIPSDPPSRLGPYVLQGLLGEGGSARVYRAYDPRLERSIALKVLKLPSPEWVARLRHEAVLQAQLHHPHLGQVFEVGEDEGRVYLAMQLILGETLGTALQGMETTQKVRVLVQVADAVHAAHRQGLIHRDLKPANILVGRDDVGNPYPYVVDFGLARIWEGQSLTAPGQVMGSPAYMAPEQAKGWNVDPRTDVYGLGAILFELLCGRPPFEGQDVVSLLLRVVEEEAPRLRALSPGIPPELEAIVERCLRKEPADRYPSAAHFRADLERFLDGEPILARPIGRVARLRKWVARNRTLAAVTGLAAAAILGLGGLLGWSQWQQARRLTLAQRLGQEVATLEGDLHRAYLLPPHDLAPLRRQLRQRIQAMENQGAKGIQRSQGLVSVAVGRALLLMEDLDGAHAHLEKALAMGEKGPEVSRAMGLACAALYREGLKSLDPTDKAGRQALQQRYRDPARTHLNLGREGSSDLPLAYLEAQLAACDGDWDLARRKAAECRQISPFFFQTFFFEGELCLDLAAEAMAKGRADEGMVLVEEARSLFQDCREVARAYPRAQLGLAACELRRLDYTFMTGKGSPAKAIAQGLAAYDASLGMDSDSVPAHSARALFLTRAATMETQQGEDPFPHLEAATHSASRALALKEDHPLALRAAFYAKVMSGQVQRNAGQDPAAAWADAVQVGEKLLLKHPGYLPVLKDMGLCASMLADYRVERGQPAGDLYDRAVELTRQAVERRASPLYHWAHGMSLLRMARAREAGGEAVAAQVDMALETFRKGAALNPAYPDLQIALGEAHTLQGQLARKEGTDPQGAWREAQACFERTLRLDRNRPEPLLGLSALALARNRGNPSPRFLMTAQDWAARCSRQHPTLPAAWISLAQAERALGEGEPLRNAHWQAALHAAQQAERLAPSLPAPAFEAILALDHLGRTSPGKGTLATESLASFLSRFPHHPGALRLKAARDRSGPG